MAPAGQVKVLVAGQGKVPDAGVSAVVLNVTVTNAKSFGFVTAFASGTERPFASNLNFVAGQTVPNLVVAPVGADGKVALYSGSTGTVDLIADVAGYYLAGAAADPGAFGSVTPARVLDTRETTSVAPAGHVAVKVTGEHGVPASGVSAVVVNVTVTNAKYFGYITAFASGTERPFASNLNFVAGQTVPNLVVVPVGTDGKIELYSDSTGSVDLIADISGYYLTGGSTTPGAFASITPARVLDTRETGSLTAAGHVAVKVTGQKGIPESGVSAVVVNVTVTNAKSFGYITAFASGGTKPFASNLNFVAGQTVPNLVVAPVGADGKIDLYSGSTGPVDLIADVSGYYLGTPTPPVHEFGEGEYPAGTGPVPGTYRNRSDTNACYWERLSGFTGDPADAIAVSLGYPHEVVTIDAADAGFYTDGCSTWTDDLSSLTLSPLAPFADGMWIVGTDVAAGTWTAPGGPECYWERLSGFSGAESEIVANSLGTTTQVVAIGAGDAGFGSYGCGAWTRS